jgi:two-component system cell cycle response regulator DivK
MESGNYSVNFRCGRIHESLLAPAALRAIAALMQAARRLGSCKYNYVVPDASSPVVLLVQADDDSRDMYAEFLRHSGLVCLTASNAADALTAAAQADVIVTGMILPGEDDGIELIDAIRRDERNRRKPLIVLTACALDGDRRRALDAGCDAFLSKPCLPDDLLQEIHRLLAARTRSRRTRKTAKTDLLDAVPSPRNRRRPA